LNETDIVEEKGNMPRGDGIQLAASFQAELVGKSEQQTDV
jgi:hypothetical protein